ncbi:MAG: tRNA 5-methylaminomethyl-2-thiouridine biosynthesis bifunctional protein [Thiomicrorhabdus sp.]|nr:MAG: tRNA 5-methylaminomethyl-2-thiouridine biosynthesis bifunctional protein [Thiomicrorhabdus sp.]
MIVLDKLTVAEVSWAENSVPHSSTFDDYYFSSDDGLAEIEHTFIQPNRLLERFSVRAENSVFRIAETGFGSGLNFLSAAQHWLKHSPESCQLHFISFEKHPMKLLDIERVHQTYSLFPEISTALCQHYPLLMPGWHDVWLFEGRIRLTLWFGDVLKGLPECDASTGAKVDAWILDGFTPGKNPDMWQPALYQQMNRLSHAQTTFATFTSAGDVRRALQAAGFSVQKASGFGKKREMCFGGLAQERPFSLKAPWFSRPDPIATGNAIVVGAGLAGASVAYQLANAGWQVTVLEEQATVASLASGNLAGTVHPLITADWNLRSQWYLQGFEAMLRVIKPWLAAEEVKGDLRGMIQLLVTETSLNRVKESLKRVGLPLTLAEWLTEADVAEKVGADSGDIKVPGVFFPDSGWLNPPSVVKRCLAHNNIRVKTQQSVQSIESLTGVQSSDNSVVQPAWKVSTQENSFQANVLVVATGSLNEDLNNQLSLPIRPVKGQVSHIQPDQQNYTLKYSVTHAGYSAPCEGGAVSGATFEAPDMSETVSIEGHKINLTNANDALPNWLNASAETMQGRIAFRPTTPDHLPIFGAVADADWLQRAYLAQSHTHAVYRYPEQRYQAGLYVSNGHGPRGLMSVFLAAESILAELQGTALVQPLSLYHASHPSRFVIRQWRSGKVANGATAESVSQD